MEGALLWALLNPWTSILSIRGKRIEADFAHDRISILKTVSSVADSLTMEISRPGGLVAMAKMDSRHRKVSKSHQRCLGTFYEQGISANELPSIQSEELHSDEEGIIALAKR